MKEAVWGKLFFRLLACPLACYGVPMYRKIPIKVTTGYQARAKAILELVKTCKNGEGVEIPPEDLGEEREREILRSAISREGRRQKVKVHTKTIENTLVVYPAV
jgi:hypothetical protein